MSFDAAERVRCLAVAEEAARAAGEILLGHFGCLDESKIGRKSSVRDLVTQADVASERSLVARLRAEFPGHAIEAEEEVQDPEAGAGVPRWFLDPLDGTTNFVHRLPIFAVSMGLFVDGEPEVAVVHCPRLGETFTAARGGGAFLNGAPLHVSGTAELNDAVLGTGFPYRRNELENDNLANFSALFPHVRGIRRMGSAAVDLAYTAAGRLDGFWELHLAPHDVAAGALLVREAGGVVTDGRALAATDEPRTPLGGDWLRGGQIVAAGAALHEAIRARLRPF